MDDATNSDTTGLIDSDAAMQPYLDIVKKDGDSMSLSTLRSLILKILADSETFCGFDEFKSHCGSFASSSAETGTAAAANSVSMANTLDLFSYGTLKDFTTRQSESMGTNSSYYLPLTDPAMMKLAQLTVMTCVQTACWDGETRISYSVLADALGYGTNDSMNDISGGSASPDSWIRKVEDVLIRCLYSKALKGKLCQKTRSFGWETESLPIVVSRDVDPTTQIPVLLSALQVLGQRLDASGAELSHLGGQVTRGLEEADKYWKAVQENRKSAKADTNRGGGVPSRHFFGTGGGGPGGSQRYESGGSSRSTPSRSSKRSRPGVGFTNESGFRM